MAGINATRLLELKQRVAELELFAPQKAELIDTENVAVCIFSQRGVEMRVIL